MPANENKEIALRFLQAWNAGSQVIVDELAAPGLVVSYSTWPEVVRGPEAFKGMLAMTFNSFPDLRIRADEVLAEGDRVALRWTYWGTFQSGELYGVAAAGQEVKVSGITFYRIAAGKVVEERGIVDNFNLMLQVGASPTPAAE